MKISSEILRELERKSGKTNSKTEETGSRERQEKSERG